MAGQPTPIPYVPEEHFPQIDQWFREWNEAITADALPRVGFIVPGTAAGFLYQTDSSVAWVESLIVPKEADKEERNRALDAIVHAIIAEAQKLGFKTLLGSTQVEAVVKRAEKLGFTYVSGGFHLVAIQL
ncbi:MAG: hypothetical protein JXB05_25550 [Myxococcaceae bacterium]|nr:hypothetical protein [Myxococcaceae bacterium]